MIYSDEILEQTHDYLVESGLATEKEIALVTSIMGNNLEAYNGIIYSRTGYHDLQQCLDMDEY